MGVTKPLPTNEKPKTKGKNQEKRIDYNSIELLNPPQCDYGAYIGTCVSGVLGNRKKNDCNVSIRIADCNKKVFLHGNLDNPKSRGRTLFKIRTLIEELEKLEQHIETGLKAHNLRINRI